MTVQADATNPKVDQRGEWVRQILQGTGTLNEEFRTLAAKTLATKAHNAPTGFLVSFAIAHGITIEIISSATGITRSDLIDPHERLPDGIAPRIWTLITEAYPGRAMTLEMAKATPPAYFGMLAHGLEFAPTVRHALTGAVRHQTIVSDRVEASLKNVASETHMSFFHPNDAIDSGATAEVGMAVAHRLFGEVLGLDNSSCLRVEFAHKPFGPVSVYEEFFETEVRFEQARNKFVFHREALDQRRHGADDALFRYVQTHLGFVRDRTGTGHAPPELRRVHRAIADNASSGEYSARALSDRLNVSLRSLQRQLRNHGCELRDLLDKAREANARQLLDDPRLNISAIAYVLGYSDDRAFRRAFKRWSGTTPAEYRKNRIG